MTETTTIIEPAEPTPETAHATPPTMCARCQRPLTWRDRMYVGELTVLCKGCHARNTRRQVRGYPIPPSALPKPPQHHGATCTKALAAQPRRRGSCGENDPRAADKHPPQRWQATTTRKHSAA